MTKFLLASAFLLLITMVYSRTVYYPDTRDPNAIVFDGPTNQKAEKRTPEINEIDNVETTDYSSLIDVRGNKLNEPESSEDETKERCPEGFVSFGGGLCYPND